MLADDLYREPDPESTPQRIFTEELDELVMVRKQDIKLGIGKSQEELRAMIDAFEWEDLVGIHPAERRQVIDDLKLLYKINEGR